MKSTEIQRVFFFFLWLLGFTRYNWHR